jgi:phage terminase large subunit
MVGDRRLTPRQRMFIENFLTTWNTVNSARAAGYKWPEKAGSKLTHYPPIEAAIQARIKEVAMGADEVLARLAQQAEVNPSDFFVFEDRPVLENGKPKIDVAGNPIIVRVMTDISWAEVERRGYMIKGIEYTRQGIPMLKFYDAQTALTTIGKHHQLFTDTPPQSDEVTQPLTLPADAIAPSFLNVYRDIRDRRHTEYLFFGGRGSTKSSFVSLVTIYLLVNNPELHALACRQVGNTLRDSVYAQLQWAIGELGLSDKFKCIASPLEIEYLPTKQKIYFRGADDPLKIKSIKPAFGYIGILWFEELDSFHGPEQVRSIEQSAIRGGDEAFIFKNFNPPRTSQNWANKYVQIPKATQYQHKSDFTTVPPEWLGKTFLEEAEHLHAVNPAAYDHEYLGIVNGTGGQVFENVIIRKITDEEIAQFDRVGQGMDFGWYPDPLAWGRSHFDANRRKLYIFDEYKANKKANRDVYNDLVKLKGVTPDQLIIGDSASPKDIADFREYGFSMRGAEKGPESVPYSYKWLQGLTEIVIDPNRCPEHMQEFLNCEYEQDKDGDYISAYPDRNNHFIDEIRYAHNLTWRRRGQ